MKPTGATLAGFLVFAIVIGYFASIGLITFAEVSDARLAQIIGLVTAVQNAFMLIVGYYFGSSSGSTRKTDMINELTGTGDGNTITTNARVTTQRVTTMSSDPDKPKDPADE